MQFATLISVIAALGAVASADMSRAGRQHYHSAPPARRTLSSEGKHVGAYFPTYNKDTHPLASVDMALYSDVYFFVTITTQTAAISLDTSANVTTDDVKQFVAAADAAGTLPILSVGGWTGSIYFSSNVATAENRTAFAKTIADFYTEYNFKGVDIDWEYPSAQGIGCNTISPDDTPNLTLFLEELRTLLPEAKLSMAAGITGIKEGEGVTATNLTGLANVLDFVNIMTYDAWGGWSATTGPVGPLSDACANDGLSVEKAVQIFLDQQFKASQLVVGIPAYGRSYTTLNSTLAVTTVGNQSSLFYQAKSSTIPEGGATDDQPGTDVCGAATAYGGIWIVSELVARGDITADMSAGGNGFTRYFDECSGTPFLFNKDTLKFIAYDDIESSVKKAAYAKSQGLKGIFFFDTAGALPIVVSSAADAL